jgi:hypothetical protein
MPSPGFVFRLLIGGIQEFTDVNHCVAFLVHMPTEPIAILSV